jgi:four helix bundle protein
MHKYRSLEAWKRAHAVLIRTLRSTDRAFHPRSRALFDQLRRAVISVEANVVEGYALGSSRQFARHLRTAVGSAAEAECLARAAAELEYLPPADVQQIETEIAGTLRVLYGLLLSIQRTAARTTTARPSPISPLPRRP